jgi:transcriptional regulator with XRE-family HTH domain
MEKLGQRIKQRREDMGLSLSALSKMAGASLSLLSQIEHGKTHPSLHTLKNIAVALNSSLGNLIGEQENLSHNPFMSFNERKLVKQTESGAALYVLTHYSPSQSIEPYMVRLENSGSCKGLVEGSRRAQEFCHVLTGAIEIDLRGKPFILKRGDSILFDSFELNSIVNLHGGISDFLWILAPDKH